MGKRKTPVSRSSERVTSQVGKGKTSRPEFFYKFSKLEYFSSNTIGGGAMKIEMHPVYLWSLRQSVCISYYQTYINKKSKHKPRIIYKYEYIAVECTDGNGGDTPHIDILQIYGVFTWRKIRQSRQLRRRSLSRTSRRNSAVRDRHAPPRHSFATSSRLRAYVMPLKNHLGLLNLASVVNLNFCGGKYRARERI